MTAILLLWILICLGLMTAYGLGLWIGEKRAERRFNRHADQAIEVAS